MKRSHGILWPNALSHASDGRENWKFEKCHFSQLQVHAKINNRIHNLHVFLAFNPWINIKKTEKIIHTKHKFCAMVARSL